MDQELLDLYADYLISSFRATTATGLSSLLEGAVSHDQISRLLSSAVCNSADLWRLVKPVVRQSGSSQGVLILDDSIEEKPYTDENEIIAWHWDHSKNRAVKGINFISALYQVSTPEMALPVAFELVRKTETRTDPKTGQTKRYSAVTKNQHARSMLGQCVRNGIPFRYVLGDIANSFELWRLIPEEFSRKELEVLKKVNKGVFDLSKGFVEGEVAAHKLFSGQPTILNGALLGSVGRKSH